MKTGDASAEIWLETADGAFYCLDVCSKLRRGVRVYHWAVDFYTDDDEATEPVEVAAGRCTSYRLAETAARRTADQNEAKRRAAKKRTRSGWSLE